jgi:hypothetical protein
VRAHLLELAGEHAEMIVIDLRHKAGRGRRRLRL